MSSTIDELGAPLYDDYSIVKKVDRVAGTLVLPCVDGDPVIIETHAAYEVTRVAFSGKGTGRPVVLPRPADTATLLSHSVTLPLPTPIQSAGGGGWVYTAVGEFTTLGTASDLVSEQVLEYPRWPQRLEPMAGEMNSKGYKYYDDDTVSGTPETPQIESQNYVFPQALTIDASVWFSDRLA